MGCHCCCYYYNEVERKTFDFDVLRGNKVNKKYTNDFFFDHKKKDTHTHTHTRAHFLLIIMPSVASFAVKKDDVAHAQANDTIKRCVEMLVVKGGFVTLLKVI